MRVMRQSVMPSTRIGVRHAQEGDGLSVEDGRRIEGFAHFRPGKSPLRACSEVAGALSDHCDVGLPHDLCRKQSGVDVDGFELSPKGLATGNGSQDVPGFPQGGCGA